MEFRNWWTKHELDDLLDEVVHATMSRGTPEEIWARIKANARDDIAPINIVNKIRHLFTNYDASWQKIEKQKQAYDDVEDYIEVWNDLVHRTSDIVNQIIETISPALKDQVYVGKLVAANWQWKENKLRKAPPRQAPSRSWGRSLVR